MNENISVAAHALSAAPRRGGGGWRRHIAIAAAGLAIVASVAGIGDRVAAVAQETQAWTDGNDQPAGDITVTSNFIAGVNETHNSPPNHVSRDRPTPSFAGYIKTVELGKLVGEIAS